MRFYCSATNFRHSTQGISGGEKGQVVHAKARNCGVRVISSVDANGSDFFELFVTGGSNDDNAKSYIGRVADKAFMPVGRK
jgi:hypothetical protein